MRSPLGTRWCPSRGDTSNWPMECTGVLARRLCRVAASSSGFGDGTLGDLTYVVSELNDCLEACLGLGLPMDRWANSGIVAAECRRSPANFTLACSIPRCNLPGGASCGFGCGWWCTLVTGTGFRVCGWRSLHWIDMRLATGCWYELLRTKSLHFESLRFEGSGRYCWF